MPIPGAAFRTASNGNLPWARTCQTLWLGKKRDWGQGPPPPEGSPGSAIEGMVQVSPLPSERVTIAWPHQQ
eukprot:9499520-Pyramimonas_sp.AAC.1